MVSRIAALALVLIFVPALEADAAPFRGGRVTVRAGGFGRGYYGGFYRGPVLPYYNPYAFGPVIPAYYPPYYPGYWPGYDPNRYSVEPTQDLIRSVSPNNLDSQPGFLATVEVLLPVSDATVEFDGRSTTSVGKFRIFQTPELKYGKTYEYAVKASWKENGRDVHEERKVEIKAGQKAVVDFTKPQASVLKSVP